MAAYVDRAREMSRRLIIKYGTAITVTSVEEPQYEAGTHRPYWTINGAVSYTPPNDLTQSGYAVIRAPRTYEITEGRIRLTDLVFETVFVDDSNRYQDFEPGLGDIITAAGAEYNIIHINPIKPNLENILFIIYARRS